MSSALPGPQITTTAVFSEVDDNSQQVVGTLDEETFKRQTSEFGPRVADARAFSVRPSRGLVGIHSSNLPWGARRFSLPEQAVARLYCNSVRHLVDCDEESLQALLPPGYLSFPITQQLDELKKSFPNLISLDFQQFSQENGVGARKQWTIDVSNPDSKTVKLFTEVDLRHVPEDEEALWRRVMSVPALDDLDQEKSLKLEIGAFDHTNDPAGLRSWLLSSPLLPQELVELTSDLEIPVQEIVQTALNDTNNRFSRLRSLKLHAHSPAWSSSEVCQILDALPGLERLSMKATVRPESKELPSLEQLPAVLKHIFHQDRSLQDLTLYFTCSDQYGKNPRIGGPPTATRFLDAPSLQKLTIRAPWWPTEAERWNAAVYAVTSLPDSCQCSLEIMGYELDSGFGKASTCLKSMSKTKRDMVITHPFSELGISLSGGPPTIEVTREGHVIPADLRSQCPGIRKQTHELGARWELQRSAFMKVLESAEASVQPLKEQISLHVLPLVLDLHDTTAKKLEAIHQNECGSFGGTLLQDEEVSLDDKLETARKSDTVQLEAVTSK